MVVEIDPHIAGISGDMLLCSLVDLGASKNKIIDGIKKSEKFLSNSTIHKIDFQKTQKCGVESTQLILEIDDNVHERMGSEIKKAIIESVKILELSDDAKKFSEACINSLISAESKIHGIPENSVHFHEASSIDTLIDIVGITVALDDLRLYGERIVCMPVSVGNDTVTFSHGTMSNPASAILEIFKNSNLIISGNNSNTELTTPTGACILVNLTNDCVDFYPSMKVESIGYGAGQKDFESFSNVLKIVKGNDGYFDVDSVKILETNVYVISGEILGNLIEKIMSKGAKDVSIYNGITKKGRPTNLVSVICDDDKVDEIVDILVLETGTLGIRIFESNRFVVPRSDHKTSIDLNGKSFEIHYKKSSFKGKTDFKIEFDDLKNISNSIDKSIKETNSILRKEIKKLENLT